MSCIYYRVFVRNTNFLFVVRETGLASTKLYRRSKVVLTNRDRDKRVYSPKRRVKKE